MRNTKWEDNEIKELLKKMPMIKSNQSAESMYQVIQQKSNKKTKIYQQWLPIVASVATIFLLVILLPSFLSTDTPQFSGESADITTMDMDENEMEQQYMVQESENSDGNSEDMPSQELAEESAQESSIMIQTDTTKGKALYASEIAGQAILSTAVVTQDAYVIPMTFTLPNDDSGQSAVELYNEWSSSIEEETLGFSEYHPMKGVFSEEDTTVSFALTNTVPYTMGSTSEAVFYDVLRHSFSNTNYEELHILNEQGNLAEIGETGQTEPIQLTSGQKAYYVYEHSEKEDFYYIPSNDSFTTIEEAITAIQTTLPNDRFISAIPKNLSLSFEGKDTHLFVTLDRLLDDRDKIELQQFVEVLLLTAKSFGYEKVQFNNLTSDSIDGFDLTKPIEVPIGVNQESIK